MLKVITFNILCSGTKGEGNSIPERAPRVKKAMEPFDPDVVGFQEATEAWMPYLEEYYGEEYEIFNHWRKNSNHESTPIMWKKDRFECLEKGYFWFSDAPTVEYAAPWDTRGCNRICMWVKLWDKKDGVAFTFFNTHYGFGNDYQVKSSQLMLNHMKAIGGPCLATADYNMGAGSPGYNKLTEQLVDVNAATVNDPRATYNGFRDTPCTCKPGDLCFITPETITPITSKLIDTMVDGKFPSDHFGVYFELEVHETVRMLSLNVWCGGKEEDAKRVRRFLRAEAPDIIGLQEVTPVFEEQLRQRLTNYDMALKYRSVKQSEGTPILWRKDRFDLIHEEHFWLSDTPEQEGRAWGGNCIRIATLVVLQYKGTNRRICVLNTHFDFAAEHHVHSVALIKERLAPYADLPILASADYNMTPGSPGYQAMTEILRDVRWVVNPLDNTPTTNNRGKCAQNYIIDYVFVNDRGIQPTGYQVIHTLTKDGYLSDHNALKTTFVLK